MHVCSKQSIAQCETHRENGRRASGNTKMRGSQYTERNILKTVEASKSQT